MFVIICGTTTIKCIITLTVHLHTPDVQTQEGLTDDHGPDLLYLFVFVESCGGRDDGSTHTGHCGLVLVTLPFVGFVRVAHHRTSFLIIPCSVLFTSVSYYNSLYIEKQPHATATATRVLPNNKKNDRSQIGGSPGVSSSVLRIDRKE